MNISEIEPDGDLSEDQTKLNAWTNGNNEDVVVTNMSQPNLTAANVEESEDRSVVSNSVATEWNNKETKYLLKKYNKYILQTGSCKKFRTKRELWNHIAYEMRNDLKGDKSGFQCENRYKTILRKWRKKEKSNKEKLQTDLVDNQPTPHESPTVVKNVATLPDDKKKELPDIMWEIFKQKEQNRERRHKEKMQLIKSILQNYV